MGALIVADTPYEILGDEGIRDLVDAFYEAMDDLAEARTIRAMHAEDLAPVKRMLVAYLTGWMGGPPVYRLLKGTVCLTDPHKPYRIGPKERDAWLACMDEALIRIGASDELKQMLKEPMFRVADTVRNADEADPTQHRDPNLIASG